MNFDLIDPDSFDVSDRRYIVPAEQYQTNAGVLRFSVRKSKRDQFSHVTIPSQRAWLGSGLFAGWLQSVWFGFKAIQTLQMCLTFCYFFFFFAALL